MSDLESTTEQVPEADDSASLDSTAQDDASHTSAAPLDAGARPAGPADDAPATVAADDAEDREDDVDEADAPAGSGPSGRSNRVAQLDAEGDIAADYLEELLDIADLDGDIDTYTEGGRAHVSIVTDADLLVGRDGEVLEALQELARLAVMTETGHRSRLMLDVAGFREKQRTELRALAHDAIQEVRETNEAVALAPMNPFERKIVHDAVAEAGLQSESEGVEPRRHVVVLPA